MRIDREFEIGRAGKQVEGLHESLCRRQRAIFCSRVMAVVCAAISFAIIAGGLFFGEEAAAQAASAPYTTGYRFDGLRRLVGEISADPSTTGNPLPFLAKRFTFDPDGRLVKTEEGTLASWQADTIAPSAWTGFVVLETTVDIYDNNDNKIEELVYGSDGSLKHVTQMSYTADDRIQCTAIRMNPAVFGSLPTSACVPGTQGTQGPDRITVNVYDAADELVQVRKGVGTPVEEAYATYSYTADGQQEYVIDANGNRSRLVWDGFDRQVQWQFPSSVLPTAFDPTTPASALASAGPVNPNDYEQYGYDENGNRTSLRKRDGRTINFNFDSLNRLTSKTFGGGACVSGFACSTPPPGSVRDVYYSYDLRGLQTSARFDSSSGTDAVLNQFDGFGRLTSSTVSMQGTSRTILTRYDADGDRVRVTHPDGVYFTFDYDGLDRQIAAHENGGTTVATVTYDSAGRRSGDTRSGAATTYTYDPISRPTSLADDLAGTTDDLTTTFGYNSADQIVARTRSNDAYAFNGYVSVNRAYVVNGLNQYTSGGPASFTYDANGNLTGDGTNTYIYDVENRLVARSGGLTLSYDPNGSLWQTTGGASGTTRYLYDGDELAAEYDGSGTLLRRYMHGPDEDDPVLWYEGAGLSDRRSLQIDQQGSIVSIANSTGSRIAIDSYDEYGIPGAGNIGRFQYTGQAWLPDLGLYYYKARMYSPTLGRFMQTDPIGYKDQINLYEYVNDDPIDNTDPNGTDMMSSVVSFVEAAAPPVGRGILATTLDIAATVSGPVIVIGGIFYSPPAGERTDFASTRPNIKVANVTAGRSRDNSRAKRRAGRSAQRKARPTIPTSRPGRNVQNAPGEPRGQIKEGSDGAPVGVADGSRDRNNSPEHPPGMEAGKLKPAEPIGTFGQPRIQNPGKGKAPFGND